MIIFFHFIVLPCAALSIAIWLIVIFVGVGIRVSIWLILIVICVHVVSSGVRWVVVICQIEGLLARVYVEHADGVLGTAYEQDVRVTAGRRVSARQWYLREGAQCVRSERVHFEAGAIVYGEPLILFVAREQKAVRGLGGRRAHQLRDRVWELFEAFFLVGEYV